MDKRRINHLYSQEQTEPKRRRLGSPTQDEGALANALLNLCKGRNDTKSELTSRLLESSQKGDRLSTSLSDESDCDDSNTSNNFRMVHHVAGTSEKGSSSLLPVCESLPIGKPLSAAPLLPNYIYIKDMYPLKF